MKLFVILPEAQAVRAKKITKAARSDSTPVAKASLKKLGACKVRFSSLSVYSDAYEALLPLQHSLLVIGD
jgi:hypothetical protein